MDRVKSHFYIFNNANSLVSFFVAYGWLLSFRWRSAAISVAVQVVLMAWFPDIYSIGIFGDWRAWPNFKVKFETAVWLELVATATKIVAERK